MDWSKLQPTAKVTYTIGGEPVTLEVRYMGADVLVDYVTPGLKTSERNSRLLLDAVVGWDLVEEDKVTPTPCTPENKARLLPWITGRYKQVKNEAGELVDGSTPIGWDLLAFVQDPDNFVKN